MRITIKPASFSKAQLVEDVRSCLKEWPLQDTNNVKAFAYSIEFVEEYGGPVGTLSEYKEYDEFVITLKNGVMLVRKIDNKFVEVMRYELVWYDDTNDGYIRDNITSYNVSPKDVYEAALKQLNS